MAAIEATAVLGTLIISDNVITIETANCKILEGKFRALDQSERERCLLAFTEGIELLHVLAQRSPLAVKGSKMMSLLQQKIVRNSPVLNSPPSSMYLGDRAPKEGSPQLHFSGTRDTTMLGDLPSDVMGKDLLQDFPTLEWEAFSGSTDMSWFFSDPFFQDAGVGDMGMDLGLGLESDYIF